MCCQYVWIITIIVEQYPYVPLCFYYCVWFCHQSFCVASILSTYIYIYTYTYIYCYQYYDYSCYMVTHYLTWKEFKRFLCIHVEWRTKSVCASASQHQPNMDQSCHDTTMRTSGNALQRQMLSKNETCRSMLRIWEGYAAFMCKDIILRVHLDELQIPTIKPIGRQAESSLLMRM